MASSILKYFISMVFIFSTVYTMAFYYFAATGEVMGVPVLDESTPSAFNSTAVADSGIGVLIGLGFIEWMGEFLSWLSPFALVKALMVTLLPPLIYQPINLLFLRPIGWIGAWITTEWVINKIRGSSEE